MLSTGSRSAISRRRFLHGAAATLTSGLLGGSARASPISDDVVITFYNAVTETVLALGVQRFGAALLRSYGSPPGLSPPPEGVFDIGTSSEPNLELLKQIRPRMFLHSPEWPPDPLMLRPIAPVEEIPIYADGGNPFVNAGNALLRIGDLLDLPEAARTYRNHVEDVMEVARERTAPYRHLRFVIMNSPNAVSMGTSGRGSLFDCVLSELGLKNAVTEQGNLWGFTAIPMKDLLAMDDVWAVHIGAVPRKLRDNPFWQVLPFIRSRRFVELPEIWQWGGLPSAAGFAMSLGDAIKRAHDEHHA